ncbi:hypothetical protein GG804_26435 [Sphingomonas histidinilytica]|uniref:hypothetical protein n=1 Tax=Rhizorhabdus histidinilytica TaxID=439228 RepID=UPI001ADC7523|nr:hypothetical protein [Rhizorhabdus histidinilytica]MBO9380308.1 hypothetical protein [Rhizorhabdus histidinilytica]
MSKDEQVEVIQADRDRAAEYYGSMLHTRRFVADIRSGAKRCELAEDFARHRFEALRGGAAQVGDVERVAAAIEADLIRQCGVQSGVEYHPADECGVASVSMNIVIAEVARAAIDALDAAFDQA